MKVLSHKVAGGGVAGLRKKTVLFRRLKKGKSGGGLREETASP